MKFIILTAVFVLFINQLFSQDTTSLKEKPFIKTIKVFGNLYAGYYYSFNDNTVPKSAFNMPTALLGVCSQISDNVKTTLIYDVTRTTNFSFPDSIGISGYFEGSKYTAFLKMAQIDWKIKPNVMFSAGQLLNEQYLTVQDKWWGHRYVDVSFQEKNRFGMPADFGARLTYYYKEIIAFSLSAVNGEGPFYYQDSDGKHLFSANFQFTPNKKTMIKLYTDIQESSAENSVGKSSISGFAGFKTEKIMCGAEFNMLNNANYTNDSDFDYSGVSIYSGYYLKEDFEVFARFDHILSHSNNLLKDYLILGVQYSPAKTYHISINYRNNNGTMEQGVFANFGASF